MAKPDYSFLRSPKWIAGIVIAGLAIVLFVNLGLWQLRRLDERRALNETITARMSGEPEQLDDVIVQFGTDPDSLEYRRVSASGDYDPTAEVIVQARSQAGRSGHNVATPLRTPAGDVLVVNRGWVPIDVSEPPVEGAESPTGPVTVTGILRKSETFGPLGTIPTGEQLTKIGRIDLPTLEQTWGNEIMPVFLALETQDPAQSGDLPVPLMSPLLDEGRHLSYAFQWFLFAAVVAVGFPILVVRTARREPTEERNAAAAPPG